MAPAMIESGDGPPRAGSRLRAAFVCLRIWVLTDSSAEATSSRAAFPAPLVSSFAARPTRSATSLLTCLRSTCFRSGTPRHPLRHLLGRFVFGRLDQVAMAENANQAAVLGNRQAPDLLAFHLAARLLDVVLRRNDRDLRAHHVLGRLAPGSCPSAMQRITMSRSVITPITVPPSSMTGMNPASSCFIFFATSITLSFFLAEVTVLAIASRTFMGAPP